MDNVLVISTSYSEKTIDEENDEKVIYFVKTALTSVSIIIILVVDFPHLDETII